MFERLAVLDGSPPGSVDAVWTQQQCEKYPNVVYSLEAHANISTPPTDQTAREAATRMLLSHSSSSSYDELNGRWILNAHPDEFYLQDMRKLVAHLSLRDPRATCILFGAAYVLPTRGEFEAIEADHGVGSRTGHESFEPIEHLAFADAEYRFKEPRLYKWVPGSRWGTRHSITTPEHHPGHRVWPTARDAKLQAGPFFVHFKVHDFSSDAFAVAEGCGGGQPCAAGKRHQRRQSAWIAFNRSGFATGLAPHRTHGRLSVDRRISARDQVLRYYELSGRQAVKLDAEVRRRCSTVVPRCSVAWNTAARFRDSQGSS